MAGPIAMVLRFAYVICDTGLYGLDCWINSTLDVTTHLRGATMPWSFCCRLRWVGGSGGSPTGSTQTTHVGPVAVSFSGHPQTAIAATTGLVSAVGQAGASYSTLSIDPAHSLSSTILAYMRLMDAGSQLYTIPAVGGGSPSLLVHSGESQYATMSQSWVIAFLTLVAGDISIDTILSDGSQQKSVVLGTTAIPSISPNGATIAYVNSEGNIYTVPSGGGTPTAIYTGATAVNLPVVWSPNSAQIAFTGTNESTLKQNVYTMVATGGVTPDITPPPYAGGNLSVTSWSPDGNSLLCTYVPSGATNSSIAVISPTVGYNATLSPSAYSDSCATFAPDSAHIAFYRGNAGGSTPGIYTSDAVLTNPQLLLADPPSTGGTGPVLNLVWSSYQESQIFVGAHGTITASPVAGFLASQSASQFASLLTFTATTPSTATLTQSATSGSGAPLVFTLGADSITNISYTNVFNGAHSTIPLTSTPTALVTIDGTTGFVDYVVPAIAGKGRPMAAQSTASALTYTGQFSAIFDGSGKNLAPSGATTVQFDRTTGKLLSFR